MVYLTFQGHVLFHCSLDSENLIGLNSGTLISFRFSYKAVGDKSSKCKQVKDAPDKAQVASQERSAASSQQADSSTDS